MSKSEYEKKRDEAANIYRHKTSEGDLTITSTFKAGSDFGREYQRGVEEENLAIRKRPCGHSSPGFSTYCVECEVEQLRNQLHIAIKGLEKIGNYFCACSVDYEIVPQVEATQTLKRIVEFKSKDVRP